MFHFHFFYRATDQFAEGKIRTINKDELKRKYPQDPSNSSSKKPKLN